ncbi:MAG: hypothetical protein IKV88_06420 [Clostridia bacterium]|nr:hypothetical protein [Clostridia bacterium]
MKKNFCRVLAMVVAAIMMMSVAAFADIDTPEVAEEIATITISGLTTGEEATILVLNAGTDPATLADDDSNIIYIDQTTVADGKVTFTVDASAAKADEDGKKYVDIYSGYSSMTGDPFKLASVLISDVEEPEAPTVVYGEVDGFEGIELGDAIVVLTFATGSASPTAEQKVAANVDGLEGIELGDAILVLQKATGSIDKFPVEE